MASKRLELSDDELLQKIGAAVGEVMLTIGQRRTDGLWAVLLVDRANSNTMALSLHDDRADAERDGHELELRLDQLAETRPGLRIRLMSDPRD